MVARKKNGLIVLLVFHTIFHELGASQNNLHRDKHGRSWKKMIDPESKLVCFTCTTDVIFPHKPYLEKKVRYI